MVTSLSFTKCSLKRHEREENRFVSKRLCFQNTKKENTVPNYSSHKEQEDPAYSTSQVDSFDLCLVQRRSCI